MKLIKLCCIALLMLLASVQPMAAQSSSSMTDAQVMEYIRRENEKGTSQSQILTKLMERGVPVEQVQRIRKKYEAGKTSTQQMEDDQATDRSTLGRLRKNNGEDKKTETRPGVRRPQRDKRTDVDEDFDEEFGDSLELRPKKPERQIFGRDIFNNKNLTFEPDMNIATPDDYKLGPGDAVYVDIWGASQKSLTSTVSPEGEIEIEGYGPVQVGGLTVAQANSRLSSTVGRRYSGSSIKLSVGQTKTISVNVMGAVEMPGTYTLSAFATVFHALYMAGGTNEIGSLRDIRVYRNGRQITTVDVYDYILNGNLKGNVRLASGDVIIVNPYECLVNVTGKVKRPMFYEMKPNESVGTLIKYAGGFAGDAYRKSVRLIRKTGNMKSVFTVDEFEQSEFKLADADSVFVDSVLDRFSNMVEVKGAVFRPGMYQVDGNVATVRQLIERAGGVTEDAILTRGVMHRMKADRTLEVLPVDVDGILKHAKPDVSLKNEDVLYIPSQKELMDERRLTIWGEVMHPGEFVYADNMTLEDLILQSGGLTDAASVMKVEISRRIRNNTALETPVYVAKSYSFEIKDGFVVTGEPGFALEPYDEVFVRKSPGYMEQEHVTVEGEVPFAGTYVLTKKNYRLSDLIAAAGGVNKEAYIAGAKLLRKMELDDAERHQAVLNNALKDDSLSVRGMDFGEERYIGIDLKGAIENPGSEEWDVVLQDGDRLVIPLLNNTVSINGEVLYPNTVTYKSGAKLSYYIDQAGGYSQKARKSKVFAIQMNGTVTRVKSAKDIQPGCEIIVPVKKDKKGLSFSEIISLGSITATLAAVIATLVK